jgi:hypothetical protein
MGRNELIAYGLAVAVGGAVAGHIAGPVGVLGVFGGVCCVGYAELLVELSRAR